MSQFTPALAPTSPGPKTKQLVHVADMTAEQAYIEGDPLFVNAVEVGGYRTLLLVPMLKERGVNRRYCIYRQEVRPFTDKQIALVQNFAAQAVIAIENTRLLNELRQRTDDLTESLEQQTATSEVLGVIGSSPGDLEPVFQTMLANATRLCAAKFGLLYLREGDAFRTSRCTTYRRRSLKCDGAIRWFTPVRRHPSHAWSIRKSRSRSRLPRSQAYIDQHPKFVTAVELGGVRALLNVPMLKEDESWLALSSFIGRK